MPDAGWVLAIVLGIISSKPLWDWARRVLHFGAAREEREISRARKDRDRAETELSECEKQIDDLRRQIAELREDVARIERHSGSNFMRWVKDREGRITWFNDRAFGQIFVPLGIARARIKGSTFREMGIDVTGEIEMLDRHVRANVNKTYSITTQLHPDLPLMTVAKVATPSAPNGEIEFEGMAHIPGNTESIFGPRRTREQRRLSAEKVLKERKDDN